MPVFARLFLSLLLFQAYLPMAQATVAAAETADHQAMKKNGNITRDLSQNIRGGNRAQTLAGSPGNSTAVWAKVDSYPWKQAESRNTRSQNQNFEQSCGGW
jgi:hypothetical protein